MKINPQRLTMNFFKYENGLQENPGFCIKIKNCLFDIKIFILKVLDFNSLISKINK